MTFSTFIKDFSKKYSIPETEVKKLAIEVLLE